MAPYSGAAVKVKFETKRGYPVLISLAPEVSLPLGAEVLDENNEVVGMVGQGNQLYVRVSKVQGVLRIANAACKIVYDISDVSEQDQLIRLRGVCRNEEA
ncbi:FimD/PapC C-terminal domain-containing protein [Vitreoscilla massiliensis]|nr:FimD/PapC C-terminal domain-containing protein [Vitreoscilla massiliensis]